MKNYLEKRDLINKVYDKIIKEQQFIGSPDKKRRLAEEVIKIFMLKDENRCKKCAKINWEKFALMKGIEVENEFVNGLCGFCNEVKDIKRKYIYSPSKEKWTKIGKSKYENF